VNRCTVAVLFREITLPPYPTLQNHAAAKRLPVYLLAFLDLATVHIQGQPAVKTPDFESDGIESGHDQGSRGRTHRDCGGARHPQSTGLATRVWCHRRQPLDQPE
jgi:hypothetical protein